LVYLSICDLVTATGNIFGRFLPPNVSTLCTIQSSFTTFSSMSSFMWTISIAVYLYLTIKVKDIKTPQKTFWIFTIFHAVCWGVPLLSISWALMNNALGYDDSLKGNVGWCWIAASKSIRWPKIPESQIFWEFVSGKGLEILSYFLALFLYIASKRELSTANERFSHLTLNVQFREAMAEADRKLILVPAIFILVRIWGTVRIILIDTVGQSIFQQFWLAVMQGIGDSAQGWANCILFCFFTKKIRELMLLKWCCCCYRSSEYAQLVSPTGGGISADEQ